MLTPKKVKHRKWQKGRSLGRKIETRGVSLAFGNFGLKAESGAWVNGRQIEAARRTISNFIKREGKVWIRIFPDKPITKKPLEVRQGKGKGAVEYWVAAVQRGSMLYELDGVKQETAKEAFRLAAAKLPVLTTFVTRTVM